MNSVFQSLHASEDMDDIDSTQLSSSQNTWLIHPFEAQLLFWISIQVEPNSNYIDSFLGTAQMITFAHPLSFFQFACSSV